jgi:hypothetical protein
LYTSNPVVTVLSSLENAVTANLSDACCITSIIVIIVAIVAELSGSRVVYTITA